MPTREIKAGLTVAVNADQTGQIVDLNNTVKQANQSQIQQNELINKLLREMGDTYQQTNRTIVEHVRKERDVTAGMNSLSAAAMTLRTSLYKNVVVIRNLGGMVTKTLTVLSPWLTVWNLISRAVDYATDIYNRFTGTVEDSVPKIQKAAEDINIALQAPVKQMEDFLGQDKLKALDTILKKYGNFFSPEQGAEQNLEEEQTLIKQEIDKWRASYAEAKAGIAGVKLSLDSLHARHVSITGTLSEQEKIKKRIEKLNEKRTMDAFAEANELQKQLLTQEEINKLLEERGLNERTRIAQELQLIQLVKQVGEPGYRNLWELQKKLDQVARRIEEQGSGDSGKGKDKDTSPFREISKDFFGDLTWFQQEYDRIRLGQAENWYSKIQQWEAEAWRRWEKDAKTRWEKEKGEWYIRETLGLKVAKGLEEQHKKVTDLLDSMKTDTSYLEYLDLVQLPSVEAAKFMDISIQSLNAKAQGDIKRGWEDLKKWSTTAVREAYAEELARRKDLQEQIDKITEQLSAPMLSSGDELALETQRNILRDLLADNTEFYEKLSALQTEYSDKELELRKQEIEAWADKARIIKKDTEYWKGTKIAMDAVIEATTELGVSEKVVHAISNYSKGIEAAADAMECQATALKLGALGDIPGAVAMQAAAVAKAAAAYAYFKNATELGGKGGTTPSVGTGQIVGSDNRERNITINMAFEGTAGAIVGPLADAFNQQASVPGGVKLNSNLIRR